MINIKWLKNLFSDKPDYDLCIKHFRQEISVRQDAIKDIEEKARQEITEHKETIREFELLIKEAELDRKKQQDKNRKAKQ